jgi:hypothetical protein
MILAVPRIPAIALAVAVTATLVGGCGGGGQSPAEAHLAALANGLCAEAENLSQHFRMKADIARLRAQLNSDQQLPRVATYLADAKASARTQAALSKLSYKEFEPSAAPLLKESTRLKRKVEADAKALGWRCTDTGPHA